MSSAVTNAGIGGPKGIPESSEASELHMQLWNNESVEDWASVMTTNVTSVYFTTVAFLPLLQASMSHGFSPRSPSVIVISSMSGLIRNSQGHFSYNAAKGATVHLSKLMSSEFEKAELRVNSIAPGYFPSELTMKESGDDNKTEMPDEKVQEKGHVPAQRPGSDEEMARKYLGSPFVPIRMFHESQLQKRYIKRCCQNGNTDSRFYYRGSHILDEEHVR